MIKSEFETWLEESIDAATQAVLKPSEGITSDEIAFGKLDFYLALRRELKGNRTPQDLGLLGAINDTLQALGVLEAEANFLSRLESPAAPASSPLAAIETSDASFAQDVLSSVSRLDVIEFSDVIKVNSRDLPNASDKMDAVINDLAAKLEGTEVRFFRVLVEFVNTEGTIQVTNNTETAKQFSINHAPTVVFLRSGQEVHPQVVGYYDKTFMERQIESALAAE